MASDVEIELSSSKELKEIKGSSIKVDEGPLMSKLSNLEFKCKALAWFIIFTSASFHFYRLFNYGKHGKLLYVL